MIRKNIIVASKSQRKNNMEPLLVQLACKYESKIEIMFNEKCVNAKSIMGIMAIGFAGGEDITIKAEGKDEEEAVNAIVDFLE